MRKTVWAAVAACMLALPEIAAAFCPPQLPQILEGADRGDPDSEYVLGYIYMTGCYDRARSYMTVIDLLHNLTYIKNYKNSVI